ncbi:glycosyltransferase [Priestia aryabhattai]|uniref:glycosyltransferase n=1 Tax=Priestia TaxID=2800373 RepID=UPI00196B4A9B|nr:MULTISPECIES: glycosyltransferase [Priestia]MED3820740.1 glycosyltransferase [Priestia aryabhattai]QSF33262.1 glycosyltransferase [Priestia megaterium]
MKKISIIVPVYNVEKYLQRCIKSLIEQTYKNIEIILVNDGSTDGCKEVCESYKKIDSRIILINKENGGLSSARNVGLDAATGEYLAFVDSDDWISTNMYEVLMKLAEQHDADISECSYLKTPSEEPFTNSEIQNKHTPVIIVKNNLEASLLHFENKWFQQVVWNKLYRRNLFHKVRFPIGKVHEDEFITYKLIYESKKLVSTTQKLYFYFERSNSIMGKGFSLKTLDRLEAFDEKERFFKDKSSHLSYLARKQYLNDSINSYYLLTTIADIEAQRLHEQKLKEDIIAKINLEKHDEFILKIKSIMFKLNPVLYKIFRKTKENFTLKV